MHTHSVIRFIGILVFFLGLSMAFPFIVSWAFGEHDALPLLYSMIIVMALGVFLYVIARNQEVKVLGHRDGVAIVTFGWIAAGFAGAVPYILSGAIPDLTDAYFESLSGFTTTGASILENIEGLPRGILMWRSITQWFGGMGIIVLSIAILPFLGVGGMQLYKAEVPSPVVDKLKPRISDTAKTLWKVYILITALEILLLFLGGMPLFEAVSHAFCTMPTGGFSPKNASIAHYNSSYFDGILIAFMIIAGINFSLHYKLLRGDLRKGSGMQGLSYRCVSIHPTAHLQSTWHGLCFSGKGIQICGISGEFHYHDDRLCHRRFRSMARPFQENPGLM
ncbi:MAG: hypothetical protein JRH06_17755, partial [Deltaproteobacteria bacterium]|nr:hypothetical protein [Deltaproteobacteria bacterium]